VELHEELETFLGTLTVARQLRLAVDVTSTLIQISQSPASFYSDPRLDQVMLSKD
jgi:hypothetical protein